MQWANRTEAGDASAAAAAPKEEEEEAVFVLQTLGTFGANEFEEALLTGMRRFSPDETQEE